jgi:hypothetical protein
MLVFAMSEEVLLEIVSESDLLDARQPLYIRHRDILPWREAYLFEKGSRDGKKTCVFIWPAGKESESHILYNNVEECIGMVEVCDDRHFSYDPENNQVVYLTSFGGPKFVTMSACPDKFQLMKELLQSYGRM